MTAATREQVGAAVEVVLALGDAIRDLGQVPDGELYARVMGRLTLRSYEAAIGALVGAGLVKKAGHLLTWAGPARREP